LSFKPESAEYGAALTYLLEISGTDFCHHQTPKISSNTDVFVMQNRYAIFDAKNKK
jgi:hypothetical protein